jgi:hypothetical protein
MWSHGHARLQRTSSHAARLRGLRWCCACVSCPIDLGLARSGDIGLVAGPSPGPIRGVRYTPWWTMAVMPDLAERRRSWMIQGRSAGRSVRAVSGCPRAVQSQLMGSLPLCERFGGAITRPIVAVRPAGVSSVEIFFNLRALACRFGYLVRTCIHGYAAPRRRGPIVSPVEQVARHEAEQHGGYNRAYRTPRSPVGRRWSERTPDACSRRPTGHHEPGKAGGPPCSPEPPARLRIGGVTPAWLGAGEIT